MTAPEPRCSCLHSRWRHLADHGRCTARYCGCVRFRAPAPEFTPEQLAKLRWIENTRPAPESYRPDDEDGAA